MFASQEGFQALLPDRTRLYLCPRQQYLSNNSDNHTRSSKGHCCARKGMGKHDACMGVNKLVLLMFHLHGDVQQVGIVEPFLCEDF